MKQLNGTRDIFVSKMNSEYRHLLFLLDRVSRAIENKYSTDATNEVLDDLLEYAQTYFHKEEKVLEHYHWPNLREHEAEHTILIYEIQGMCEKYHTGDLTTTLEAINFLAERLAKHIEGADKHYGLYSNTGKTSQSPIMACA